MVVSQERITTEDAGNTEKDRGSVSAVVNEFRKKTGKNRPLVLSFKAAAEKLVKSPGAGVLDQVVDFMGEINVANMSHW